MVARGHVPKADLTPEEKLRVAYFHLIVGWDQHDLASFYTVNPGRVNNAITTIKTALKWDGESDGTAN
jgi:hypothetical protein